MNAKTAKLLNRYATVKGFPKRLVKRSYLKRPKRKRFSDKQEMRVEIANHNLPYAV